MYRGLTLPLFTSHPMQSVQNDSIRYPGPYEVTRPARLTLVVLLGAFHSCCPAWVLAVG